MQPTKLNFNHNSLTCALTKLRRSELMKFLKILML